MDAPPETPISRGHFYLDLQDKHYSWGRTADPLAGRVLVTEIDALMNKIADRLDARPTGRRIFEQSPSQIQ